MGRHSPPRRSNRLDFHSDMGAWATPTADVVATARLAMLLTCGDDLLQMGNSAPGLQHAIQQAAVSYARMMQEPPSIPALEPKLQHVLTARLQDKRLAAYTSSLGAASQRRMLSVQSPHTTAWVEGANPWLVMTPTQYRAGLSWILGLPCIAPNVHCTVCGSPCDVHGAHFGNCVWSGSPA